MIGQSECDQIDESLRCWCRDSLDWARDRLANYEEGQPHLTAEFIVDAAAFRQMLNCHPFAEILKRANPTPIRLFAEPAFQVVVNRCPLTASNPPEILGSIHEYLVSLRGTGLQRNSTRATSKSRKSQGIFYTPTYVVDEIVSKTIGPRLSQPNPSSNRCLRILDPAAGCGAFLVVAYRYFIQHEIQSLCSNETSAAFNEVARPEENFKLPLQRCFEILTRHLFGVDLDATAIEVTRRILWLTMLESARYESIPLSIDLSPEQLATNFKQGNSLTGLAFGDHWTVADNPSSFHWANEFPQVASDGGFDVVIGNPPYRREKDFKNELDSIRTGILGKTHRSARMDLWYYFLFRGIQLLRNGGSLSYITNAYWMQGRGAATLISTLQHDVHLDELFLLRNLPIFPDVAGQHVILRVTKAIHDGETIIKVVPQGPTHSARSFFTGEAKIQSFSKTRDQLFRNGYLNVVPCSDGLLEKLNSWPPLIELGYVRQGIAENPAAINRRTLDRYCDEATRQQWAVGEGVFSLRADEVQRLALDPFEARLLRPYHDLCDLDRYWFAEPPSRQLIYSTRQSCPEIAAYPNLMSHLSRFRAILDERRETQKGSNCWWHLHWPRDDRIWQTDKLVAIQMAIRPSFVPISGSSYVPFSANVFINFPETREDLRYVCALLNSKVLWAWLTHFAKRRGIGLELNGHVLERVPIRRIDFENWDEVQTHHELVRCVERRIQLSNLLRSPNDKASQIPEIERAIDEVEATIDSTVAALYGLTHREIEVVRVMTD